MELLIKLDLGNETLYHKGVIDQNLYNKNREFLNTLWDEAIESSLSQF